MNEKQEYSQLQETKDHSDSYFPYNTYPCTIPLDFTRIPPHWHGDVELIVIKAGQGIINVDTHSYYVKAGEMIIVRPGQIHSIYHDRMHEMVYENIIFNPKILYSTATDLFTFQFFELFLDLNYNFIVHIQKSTPNSCELNSCIIKIDEYCNTKPKNYQMMIKSLLYEFFFLYVQNQEQLIKSNAGKNLGKMKQVISFMEKNYTEELTVNWVANEFGFSYSHFLKLFKENMHVTFTNYLNDYRLNKASDLLRTTDNSIMEIVELVGFNNLSYFNRIFKERYKMTPREYRKNGE